MEIIKQSQLSLQHKKTILELWNNEYPKNLEYQTVDEFENYLSNLLNPTHYLLLINDNLIGWAFTFIRENETWFAIIISDKFQQKGYGKILLNELKKDHLFLNGWVIDNNNQLKSNGNLYKSPLEFYIKNEFAIIDNIRLETEKLSAVKIIWNN